MAFSCTQCQSLFEIGLQEKELREKILSKFSVPAFPEPTLCPDCRLQKRMVWRNDRYLYQRHCDKTGEPTLSIYPPDAPFPVYSRNVWWGDGWNATDYAQDYDFSRPFFEQFAELMAKVPRAALGGSNTENCEYSNAAFDCRNCYLSHSIYYCESVLYSYFLYECKDCVDCGYCFQSEQCFECVDCNGCYNCQFCVLSNNCSDSFYLYDCRNVRNCFGCVGLRGKQYCFFNEQLSKEEYEKRLEEIDLQNPEHVKQIKHRVQELKMKHPHLYSFQEKTENCTGDQIFESKDCHDCFQTYRSQDSMYMHDAEANNALDSYHPGWSSFLYETCSMAYQQSSAFCMQCWHGGENFYCDSCRSCLDCFGCIGLNRKQYHILNKPYSKEEYEAMIPKIAEHMKQTGEWGQFFPISLSPFGYNQTKAQEQFPLSQSEVLARGWKWIEDPSFTKGKETLKWEQMPEKIQNVGNEILDEVLACQDCERNYKIIKQELKFYRDHNLPIPHYCPECRYQRRMKLRNPQKLWDRKCDQCEKDIRTSYSPERPETVYCEGCYLKEIY